MQLTVEKRNVFGKKIKPFRKEGKIPAVLYGRSQKTAPLFVSSVNFKKVLKDAGESTVIEVIEDGGKPVNAIIHDIAYCPVKGEPIHVDFYAVEMNKPIKASVQLVFEGVSPAVKEFGGNLVKVIRELEIEALPNDLPHEIKVDISALKILGDQITVKDLNLPSLLKISAKEDEVIALAESLKEESEEEKINIEDIEVAKKGKEKDGKDDEEEKSESNKK